MDRDGTLFRTPSIDQRIYDMTLLEFDDYVKTHNIFNTTFDVERKKSLPEFSGNLGWGKIFAVRNQP